MELGWLTEKGGESNEINKRKRQIDAKDFDTHTI